MHLFFAMLARSMLTIFCFSKLGRGIRVRVIVIGIVERKPNTGNPKPPPAYNPIFLLI
jgi:hypothetical protein